MRFTEKGSKKLIKIILICILFIIWFLAFHPFSISFTKLTSFHGTTVWRTENNEPMDIHQWSWYSISEKPYTEFNFEEVGDALEEAGIIVDTEQYTYIVTCGFTLKRIGRRFIDLLDFNNRSYEFPRFIGYVLLSHECDPNEITIYQIPKMYIVPSKQYRSRKPVTRFE